jgi:ABC-2 type transport system ATP-binding protein
VVAAGRPQELAKPRGVEVDLEEGTRHYEGAGREDVPRIIAELVAAGENVYGVRVLTSTLEEIYLEAVEGESS